MENQLISAIIYTELSDTIGPNPVVYRPSTFEEYDRMHVSIKTITVLSGERGMVPEKLVILPFPSLELKGLIKYIKWDDSERRGGIGQSAITLLFKEMDDVVFYKYLDYLNPPFDEAADKLVELEKADANKEQISEVISDLETTLSHLLEEFRLEEEAQPPPLEFPEQEIKDAGLINYKFKLVILGNPGVGKTSLVLRFTNNAFRRTYIPTLGVHVSDKIFKVEDSIIQLVLWDIAGQQKFDVLRQQFYFGSDGIFLIFDLTNEKSFNDISGWYFDVKKQLKNRPDLTGYVIGNKRDLTDNININSQQAIDLAHSLNLKYVETSALTGENVEYAFYTIAETLYHLIKDL